MANQLKEMEVKNRGQGTNEFPVSQREVFWVSVFFTAAAGGLCFYLALHPSPSESARFFMMSCETIWKLGIGGVFGLVLGRIKSK